MQHGDSFPASSVRDALSSGRVTHRRTSRAPRGEVQRTTRLALLLIGAGLVFAILATMLFVRFG